MVIERQKVVLVRLDLQRVEAGDCQGAGFKALSRGKAIILDRERDLSRSPVACFADYAVQPAD